MPRRHRDDDDRPRRRQSGNPAAWILLAVGTLLLFVAQSYLHVHFPDQPPADRVAELFEEQEKAEAARALTRDAFSANVIGKTPDEVIAAGGEPDLKQQIGKRDPIWYYSHRTKNAVTGKVDVYAQVIFADGKVARVNY
jgi:hypothetical protein